MAELEDSLEYFIRVRGRTQGPFDASKLRAMIARGRVGRHDQISVDGENWQRAGDWAELFSAAGERKVRRVREVARGSSPGGTRNDVDDQITLEPVDDPDGQSQLWYYNEENRQVGPLTLQNLKRKLARGDVAESAFGWTDGMENWEPLCKIPELASAVKRGREAASANADSFDFDRSAAGGYAAAADPRGSSRFQVILISSLLALVLIAGAAFGVYYYLSRDDQNADSETANSTPPAANTGDVQQPAGANSAKTTPAGGAAPSTAPAGSPGSQSPKPPSGSTGARLTPAEIYERAVPAIFMVITDRGQGSGFLLESDRVIVTNAHVVKNTKRVRVLDHGDLESPVTVLVIDEKRDLALLSVPKGFRNRKGLQVAVSMPKPGEPLIAIGTPRGQKFTITSGVASQVRTGVQIAGKVLLPGVKLIQTDVSVSPGSSGGPLLNDRGDVVGVTTLASKAAAQANNLNYAVSATEIAPLASSLPSRTRP